jgi:hypothetical protein
MEESNTGNNGMPIPYFAEIMAMLERAMAYMFTGDARVIVKSLMGPFGLKRSLLELGMPAITTAITFDEQSTNAVSFKKANWPLTDRGEPAIASGRAQYLTYGEDHFKVSVTPVHYRKSDILDFRPRTTFVYGRKSSITDFRP